MTTSGRAWLEELSQAVTGSTDVIGNQRLDANDAASTHFSAALRVDCWLWEAWSGWCSSVDDAAPPRPPSLFNVETLPIPSLPDGLLPAHLSDRLRGSSGPKSDLDNVRAFSPSAQTNSSEASTSTRSYRKLSPLPQPRQHANAQTPTSQPFASQDHARQPSRQTTRSGPFATELGFSTFATSPAFDSLQRRSDVRPNIAGPSGLATTSPFQPTATSTPTTESYASNTLDATRSLPSLLFPGNPTSPCDSAGETAHSKSTAQKRARRPELTSDGVPARNSLQNARADVNESMPKRRPATAKSVDGRGRASRQLDLPVRRSSRLQAVHSDADLVRPLPDSVTRPPPD